MNESKITIVEAVDDHQLDAPDNPVTTTTENQIMCTLVCFWVILPSFIFGTIICGEHCISGFNDTHFVMLLIALVGLLDLANCLLVTMFLASRHT